jgi:DNA-directed RNA polymerase specialized sigma24 family protein
VLAVHEALQELEERDPLKAQIVLLSYFTGLTMNETAAVLGLAGRTLDRHWRYIRACLMKRLS